MKADDETRELPDAELVRLYNDPEYADGLAFNVLYVRYRQAVRDALERAGLSPSDAEARVGVVFNLSLDPRMPGYSPEQFGEQLLAFADRIARDPHWTRFA